MSYCSHRLERQASMVHCHGHGNHPGWLVPQGTLQRLSPGTSWGTHTSQPSWRQEGSAQCQVCGVNSFLPTLRSTDQLHAYQFIGLNVYFSYQAKLYEDRDFVSLYPPFFFGVVTGIEESFQNICETQKLINTCWPLPGRVQVCSGERRKRLKGSQKKGMLGMIFYRHRTWDMSTLPHFVPQPPQRENSVPDSNLNRAGHIYKMLGNASWS